MRNASSEKFGRCAFDGLVICGIMCHDRYVEVPVPLRSVGCDVDFEYLFQL